MTSEQHKRESNSMHLLMQDAMDRGMLETSNAYRLSFLRCCERFLVAGIEEALMPKRLEPPCR